MAKGRQLAFTLARKLDDTLNKLVKEGIYIKKADVINAAVLEFCARRNLLQVGESVPLVSQGIEDFNDEDEEDEMADNE